MLEYFNISDNFVRSIEDIYNKNINPDIDYRSVNKKNEQKKVEDLNIIEKVLNGNYSNNPNAQKNKNKNVNKFYKFLKKINIFNIKLVKLKNNYYRCKLFANITRGKKREHYTHKKYSLKDQINIEYI